MSLGTAHAGRRPPADTLARIQRSRTNVVGFVDVQEFFSEGYCDRLAYALHRELPESTLVGLYSDLDKHGAPIEEFRGRLVHGAVRLGDLVLDIHGHTKVEEWKRRWQGKRPPGAMTMEDRISEPSLDPVDHLAQQVARRLVALWRRDGVLGDQRGALAIGAS